MVNIIMDFTVDAAERSTDNLPYENIKNYHHCSYFHISPANATFDKVPGELNLYIGGCVKAINKCNSIQMCD